MQLRISKRGFHTPTVRPNGMATGRIRRFCIFVICFVSILACFFGCMPPMAFLQPEKAPERPSAENRIHAVDISRRGAAVEIRIAGEGPLRFSSAKKRIQPPIVTLYFPRTVLQTHAPITVPENDLVRSVTLLQWMDTIGLSALEVVLKADASYEIVQRGNMLTAVFRTKPQGAAQAPAISHEASADVAGGVSPAAISGAAYATPGVDGVHIAAGRKPAGHSVPETLPAQSPFPMPEPGGPAQVKSIDFAGAVPERASLMVGIDRPVEFEMERTTARRLSLVLKRARVAGHLVGMRYENQLIRVGPVRERNTDPRQVVIPMELHRAVPYRVEMNGDRLFVYFDLTTITDTFYQSDTEPVAAPAVSAVDDGFAGTLKGFLESWKTAWEKTAGPSGNTADYLSHYSTAFRARGMDKNGWGMDKRGKNRERQWMRGELKNVEVFEIPGTGHITLHFFLAVESPNYVETIEKTLIVRNETDGWRIISEKSRLATNRLAAP